MMQTTQKDSFFKIIDSNIEIYGGMETGHSIQSRFDTNSSSEILQKVWSLQKGLHLNKKNILGESFFVL